MGSGKNGSFDLYPDWRQWAVLVVSDNNNTPLPRFFPFWWRICKCEIWTLSLEPIEGHGTWDGKRCFGDLPKNSDFEGMIAVLTRATIRWNKLVSFWKNVDAVAVQMAHAQGFITSLGIGEVPLIKQATFSIWESKESMKSFAYKQREHAQVIQKTRKEDWYSEDMFVRFRVLTSTGSIRGKLPLEGKL